MKVAIAGGGIAGVLMARRLKERGYDVHVFESAKRIGGLCRSEVVDGFVFDLAGGHILHSRDNDVLTAMLSTLDDPVTTVRNTKIFHHDRYVKYPFENGLSDLAPEENLQCILGYVEAFVGREKGSVEPTNFRDWITWRFGDGIARHFMHPYNEKIWCSDLRDVATGWTRNRIPVASIEEVLRASMGLESEGYVHQSTFYYPRTGGFQTLVDGYARGLEDCIRTATPVREVVLEDGAVQVNGERFDRVVNAMPLVPFLRALAPKPPEAVLQAAGALHHLSVATVLVAVDEANLSPHSWVYLPHASDGPMNRITYLSNYSPDNAPAGTSSIQAEITYPGGSKPPEPAALEKQVVDALVGNKMVRADRVRFTRSHYNEFAYPVYDHGFDAAIAGSLGWLDGTGVVSVGRFARYRYVNTDQVYAMVEETLTTEFPSLR